jgi:restriction system protein
MRKKQVEVAKYYGPVLDALRELGDSGYPKEVTEKVTKNLNISEEIRQKTNRSGVSNFYNQVAWARQHLVYAGLIDDSKRGIWVLTSSGRETTNVTEELRRKIYQQYCAEREARAARAAKEMIEIRKKQRTLLEVLKSVSPIGFEHLCQRLLTEIGFEDVKLTPKIDEGIDLIGTLKPQKLNLVSMIMIFQCKRYGKAAVSRAQVGDFRNAVMGRGDKGVIITTGTFSKDAKGEASREKVIPIELIDGQRLAGLFEELELGVKMISPYKYEVNHDFFEQYNNIK